MNPANRPTPPDASQTSSGDALRVLAGISGRVPAGAARTGSGGGMLTVIPRNCVGCRTCELTCSFVHSTHGRLARSRIKVREVGEKRFVQMTCLQCVEAACVAVCPVEALARNEATGAIEVHEGRCVGCSLCEKACPFGHMRFDPEAGLAVKCDLCKGEPMCARFCPNKALEVR
ncbi:MAG: 4Fe-4S dicluster domain-containing protein [Deltaproteobacteria bacterium]|nr:4Fe-4S dicluster domain-containing protein [Deltaproteobacteria bacterium]